MFDGIASFFSSLISTLSSFFNQVLTVLGYIWSILKALRFGLISLINGVQQLLDQVIHGSLLGYLTEHFIQLASYIGVGPTIFIATMLFIVMFRIVVAFILKFFRLNIDYKTLSTKYHLFHK